MYYKDYKVKKGPVCEACKFKPVHTSQLDVHHIDEDHDNNHPSNIETLCANCHRLMHVDLEKLPEWPESVSLMKKVIVMRRKIKVLMDRFDPKI